MKKWVLNLIIISVLVVTIGFLGYKLYFPKTGYVTYKEQAIVYMSPTCGCCSNYVGYLKDQGISVKKVYMNDISSIKTKYKIPINMQTCHTTIFGNYFVEGHVPIEAITKLLDEQPNVDGIALPGMPYGSPGMTGFKQGSFDVYSIAADGTSSLFIKV